MNRSMLAYASTCEVEAGESWDSGQSSIDFLRKRLSQETKQKLVKMTGWFSTPIQRVLMNCWNYNDFMA